MMMPCPMYTRIMIIQTISNSYSIKVNWRFSFGFQLLGHVSGSAHISSICYNSFLRHETSNASRRPPPNSGAFFGRSHHLWIPLFYIKEAITKVKLHWRPTDKTDDTLAIADRLSSPTFDNYWLLGAFVGFKTMVSYAQYNGRHYTTMLSHRCSFHPVLKGSEIKFNPHKRATHVFETKILR